MADVLPAVAKRRTSRKPASATLIYLNGSRPRIIGDA
jgi:hypothetical protein